jgi:hypothetical protein
LGEATHFFLVEGEDGGIRRQAGECLVDDRARDALALCVARDRGQECVEVAAAWCGERRGGEEQQDDGKEEAQDSPFAYSIPRGPNPSPASPSDVSCLRLQVGGGPLAMNDVSVLGNGFPLLSAKIPCSIAQGNSEKNPRYRHI